MKWDDPILLRSDLQRLTAMISSLSCTHIKTKRSKHRNLCHATLFLHKFDMLLRPMVIF